MAEITALIDANVFYAMATTDIVIETARAGLFRARWTERIDDEWMESLLANQPQHDRAALLKRRNAMSRAVRDALITGFEALESGLALPDPGDRHILAAALTGQCDVIVTFNLRHFPSVALAPHHLVAAHPDTFLVERLEADEGRFLACVKRSRERLRNPPRDIEDHLARLAKAGLPLLAARLDAHKARL